ncbi:hypothetical protein LRP52_35895 [Photobacterium sp. ZSDE20]|uniref:Uncharacterized protein n=1 Tax=Photobacterium pectinilyticum TaxID=2906793 RepID=A0ABT1N5U3_9GAMM|nr:hypothetical protein [Photobacterium sp. ZSDE20]MCQ1060112.1 hypothetical protein [Photobacterium sp. ZSDE20]MDD1827568.1 hypothetical protein [Photobacterium sp. ZSDE20]
MSNKEMLQLACDIGDKYPGVSIVGKSKKETLKNLHAMFSSGKDMTQQFKRKEQSEPH